MTMSWLREERMVSILERVNQNSSQTSLCPYGGFYQGFPLETGVPQTQHNPHLLLVILKTRLGSNNVIKIDINH